MKVAWRVSCWALRRDKYTKAAARSVQEYFDMIDAEGGSGDSESDGDLDKEETQASIILRRESPWIAPERKKRKRYDGPSSIALS